MEHYEITIVALGTGVEHSVTVEVDEGETSENIVIQAVVSDHAVTASNYNYLPAFQEFRDILLSLGYGIKCNGARINAVQSGMMGANDKMYLVELGKKPRMKDIVHIWDYADIAEFPDTQMQQAFFEQWIKF